MRRRSDYHAASSYCSLESAYRPDTGGHQSLKQSSVDRTTPDRIEVEQGDAESKDSACISAQGLQRTEETGYGGEESATRTSALTRCNHR
jgi:hypothetical protein